MVNRDIEGRREEQNGKPSRVGFGILAVPEPLERDARVVGFLPGSSAQDAGMREGDIIVDIKVRDERDLIDILNGSTDRELVLHVLRGYDELWLTVQAEEWSEQRENQAFQLRMKYQEERNRVPWWTNWYDLWGLLRR